MKLLVIGASGFVGNSIPNLKNIEVLGLDRNPLPLGKLGNAYSGFLQADVSSLTSEEMDLLKKYQPSHIVVLAGIQYTNPIQSRRSRKTAFTENLKIASAGTQIADSLSSVVHVTYISTDMVYGISPEHPISEESPTFPIGDYGKSKLGAEKIFLGCRKKIAIVRPRLIVGDGRLGTIEKLAKIISSGLPIPIIGSGNNRYQMIGVGVLWGAIIAIVKHESTGVFNVGSSIPPTLNQLFPELLTTLQLKNKIVHFPPSIINFVLMILDYLNISPLAPEQFLLAAKDIQLDTTKIQKVTGWEPLQGDTEMLAAAIKQILEQKYL